MKKIILLVASVLLMVSCGEVAQKPIDVRTNELKTNKYPALVKREENKKTDTKASENSQPIEKGEQTKRHLPEFKPTPIDLTNVPDITQWVKGATVITPTVVDLPNDLLWSRNKGIPEIIEVGEDAVLRTGTNYYQGSYNMNNDVVDKYGFTLSSDILSHFEDYYFGRFTTSVSENEKYIIEVAQGKCQLRDKKDYSIIKDFSDIAWLGADVFIKNDEVVIQNHGNIYIYDIISKKIIFSTSLPDKTIEEKQTNLFKTIEYKNGILYVCSVLFDVINNSTRFEKDRAPDAEIVLYKIDFSGNVKTLYSDVIYTYYGNISFGYDSDNIYLVSRTSFTDMYVIKFNKDSGQKPEIIFWDFTDAGSDSCFFFGKYLFVYGEAIIDLLTLKPIVNIKESIYSTDSLSTPVIAIKNNVYFFNQTSQKFDKAIQFDKDVYLPKRLGSGPVPVKSGNDLYFVDVNDLSQMKRLKSDKIENGVGGAFYSQTQNRAYVYADNLMCFGDEKGLEFTVNPTYFWECEPRNGVEDTQYKKVTIKWFGKKEVEAKIVFTQEAYEKYNKAFVLRPGVNEIDFPILDIWQFDGGKSELVIGGESHLIEIMYVGCRD